MSERFFIKRNDTSPAIAGVCERPDGTPVVITGATVRFKMRQKGSATATVDAAATITAGVSGAVKYDWQTGDTDTAGYFEAEWEVTYSDGTIETFPNYGFIPITINEDI